MSFGAGRSVGFAFWGLVAATGLGAALQASTHLLMALKITGGIHLLWLAYGSARSGMRVAPEEPRMDGSVQPREKHLFGKGLALNLSNPKGCTDGRAVSGLGGEDGGVSLIVATLGCALVGLAIYTAYAAALSHSAVMSGYATFRRWIDGMVSVLFTLAGMALLRSAFKKS